LLAITALLVVVTSALFVATAAAKPKVTNITGTTNTEWTTSAGHGALVVEGSVGLWSGGFGGEPSGDDTLSVEMKVNGEGGVSLNYQIQTTDISFFDWFHTSLTTPPGRFRSLATATRTRASNCSSARSKASASISPRTRARW
jgi:hypothetical protein